MSLTKVPSIPVPTTGNLLEVSRAVKGILDVREGYVGDPLDQNVTFRDLVDAGAVVERPSWTNRSPLSPIIPPWAETDGYDPTQDYTPPSAPSGLTVTSLFSAVQLQWALPPERNYAYAEIWRASTNAIGSAVLIGTSDTRFYVDTLGTASTRYYWVRFVTQADVKGPYNSTNGTAGNASDDPTYVIGVLSDAYGSTSLAPFFQLDAPQTINGVSIPAGTYIKSAFIADATITNAKIANLAVDNAKIATLDAAKINTGFLSADRIQAGTLDAKIANIDAAVIGSGTISAARISTASIANANITAAQITSGFIDSARINSASIVNASIDAAQIASGVITNATIGAAKITTGVIGGDLYSSGYTPGSYGWIIRRSGSAEFNGPVISRNIVLASGVYSCFTTRTYFPGDADATLGYYMGTIQVDTGYSTEAWRNADSCLVYASGLYQTGVTVWYTSGTDIGSVLDVTARVAAAYTRWRWYGGNTIILNIDIYVKPYGTVNSFAFNYGGVGGGIEWKVYKVT